MLNHEWHKSSYSAVQDCLEARLSEDEAAVQVRDSKNPNGGVLEFPRSAWRDFVDAVKTDKMTF